MKTNFKHTVYYIIFNNERIARGEVNIRGENIISEVSLFPEINNSGFYKFGEDSLKTTIQGHDVEKTSPLKMIQEEFYSMVPRAKGKSIGFELIRRIDSVLENDKYFEIYRGYTPPELIVTDINGCHHYLSPTDNLELKLKIISV